MLYVLFSICVLMLFFRCRIQCCFWFIGIYLNPLSAVFSVRHKYTPMHRICFCIQKKRQCGKLELLKYTKNKNHQTKYVQRQSDKLARYYYNAQIRTNVEHTMNMFSVRSRDPHGFFCLFKFHSFHNSHKQRTTNYNKKMCTQAVWHYFAG